MNTVMFMKRWCTRTSTVTTNTISMSTMFLFRQAPNIAIRMCINLSDIFTRIFRMHITGIVID